MVLFNLIRILLCDALSVLLKRLRNISGLKTVLLHCIATGVRLNLRKWQLLLLRWLELRSQRTDSITARQPTTKLQLGIMGNCSLYRTATFSDTIQIQ